MASIKHFTIFDQHAPPARVKPNDPCPCGSAQKHKKCCGAVPPADDLCRAAYTGDDARVVSLLNAGAVVDKMANGSTPMTLACFAGHVQIVSRLIDKGANVNKSEDIGDTPLSNASLFGHLAIVSLLVKTGADVDHPTAIGLTPLHCACSGDHLAVVSWLIEAGASLDMQTAEGATPLFLASQDNNLAIASVLVKAGADIEKAFSDGASPLAIACFRGHLAVASWLIEAGADITSVGNEGYTPLDAASMAASHCGCVETCDHKAIVNKLIMAGALTLTAVNKLIEAGKINEVGNDGLTFLHKVSFLGHLPSVLRLLEAGVDVNPAELCFASASHSSYTPLFLAVDQGHSDIVRLLIKNGAVDPSATSSERVDLDPAVLKAIAKQRCAACSAVCKVKWCRRCRRRGHRIGYCSTECQKANWEVHKIVCNKMRPRQQSTTEGEAEKALGELDLET